MSSTFVTENVWSTARPNQMVPKQATKSQRLLQAMQTEFPGNE